MIAPKKEDESKPESKPVDTTEKTAEKPVEPDPTPPAEPSKSDSKTTRSSSKKQEIVFNPFYKSVGIPYCPACGETKRTGMDGKQICTQTKKPENCWVKD